ncbi:MAG: hypothetical protein WCO09_01605 [bacterium]
MKNNIKNIAIVDGDPKSLEAAIVAVREIMPEVEISTFNSAEEVLTEIGGEIPFYDIVITAMKMEKSLSGRKVAYQSWLCGVPAVIVSGGEDGSVHLGYTPHSSIGSKHDVNVWKEIIEFIFSESYPNRITTIIRNGKASEQNHVLAELGVLASEKFLP